MFLAENLAYNKMHNKPIIFVITVLQHYMSMFHACTKHCWLLVREDK